MRRKLVDFLWRKGWYDLVPEILARQLPLPSEIWRYYGVDREFWND